MGVLIQLEPHLLFVIYVKAPDFENSHMGHYILPQSLSFLGYALTVDGKHQLLTKVPVPEIEARRRQPGTANRNTRCLPIMGSRTTPPYSP